MRLRRPLFSARDARKRRRQACRRKRVKENLLCKFPLTRRRDRSAVAACRRGLTSPSASRGEADGASRHLFRRGYAAPAIRGYRFAVSAYHAIRNNLPYGIAIPTGSGCPRLTRMARPSTVFSGFVLHSAAVTACQTHRPTRRASRLTCADSVSCRRQDSRARGAARCALQM